MKVINYIAFECFQIVSENNHVFSENMILSSDNFYFPTSEKIKKKKKEERVLNSKENLKHGVICQLANQKFMHINVCCSVQSQFDIFFLLLTCVKLVFSRYWWLVFWLLRHMKSEYNKCAASNALYAMLKENHSPSDHDKIRTKEYLLARQDFGRIKYTSAKLLNWHTSWIYLAE